MRRFLHVILFVFLLLIVAVAIVGWGLSYGQPMHAPFLGGWRTVGGVMWFWEGNHADYVILNLRGRLILTKVVKPPQLLLDVPWWPIVLASMTLPIMYIVRFVFKHRRKGGRGFSIGAVQ